MNNTLKLTYLVSSNVKEIIRNFTGEITVIPLNENKNDLYTKIKEDFYNFLEFYESLKNKDGEYKFYYEKYYKLYKQKKFNELVSEYEKLFETEIVVEKSYEEEYLDVFIESCEKLAGQKTVENISYDMANFFSKYNEENLSEKIIMEGINLSMLICSKDGLKKGQDLLFKHN